MTAYSNSSYYLFKPTIITHSQHLISTIQKEEEFNQAAAAVHSYSILKRQRVEEPVAVQTPPPSDDHDYHVTNEHFSDSTTDYSHTSDIEDYEHGQDQSTDENQSKQLQCVTVPQTICELDIADNIQASYCALHYKYKLKNQVTFKN